MVVEPEDPAKWERPDDSALRALGIDPWADQSDGGGAPDQGPADRFDDDAEVVAPVAVADTPLWLSHHWPEDYDRCAVVGGLHVCRRCLVLYPLALVAGVAVSLGSWWDHSLDPWVLWLMPLPGVIEFVLDNLRIISYRPVRQMVLSAGGAIAAGVGYVRYLDDTTDRLAWTVLLVYTAATLSAAIVGGLWRRRSRGQR
ncbi:MAG: hypothetical protein GX643_06155 [Acidimicrobiales bacterium]|nr:hypothetical protein [Acidimicrobiales bacterium]